MIIMNIPAPRRRLARIRCLQECIVCLKERRKLPGSLCYVASELEYQCAHKTILKLYIDEHDNGKKIPHRDLTCLPGSKLYVTGEDFCNNQGKWLRLKKCKCGDTVTFFPDNTWILLYSSKSSTEDVLPIVPVVSDRKQGSLNSWEDVVDSHFSLQLPCRKAKIIPPHDETVSKLQAVPLNWSLEHDEALVRLMSQHLSPENEQLGTMKNYVDSIDVSTFCDEAGPGSLTDGDPDTFWESDGSQGQHWIQLRMKKGTIVKKLHIVVDGSDDNYLPSRIVVQGGEQDNLKLLNTVNLDWDISDSEDIVLLEHITEHYPIIMIKIKECKAGGIDCRIRGVKITSTEERNLGFDVDFFKPESLVRYPKLESYSADQLYRRSLVLQRFMTLLDSVLQYIVPAWEFSIGSYTSLEYVRQLLPLSKKRLSLVETFLKESSTERPQEMPKLFLNRHSAMEHKADLTADLECKKSIFVQIFEGLKPRERQIKPLDYRWSSHYYQWWECKLMSEGVIDQGGGFRDSLCDLAEELCPMSSDGLVSLPFFIRSPNQLCEDANVNRDVYIPNSSCQMFDKYEWIGQLLGACLRGSENLVLSLPSFIWKKLAGENVSWNRDFHTINAAEVKLVESLELLEPEPFEALCRTWSTILSNGDQVVIRADADGNPLPVEHSDRSAYCEEVCKVHMSESDDQIAALRKGLLKVVPQAVLDLLTWQELEQRVSGDPEITLESLKSSTHYDDLEETDIRVKYFWEALKNFSNEDRSRFLRFVTGRRRLPAPLYISSGKGYADDCLPESSTCANMLYLPNFSSAKVAESKIRYAAYNCVDLDTDLNPWDD